MKKSDTPSGFKIIAGIIALLLVIAFNKSCDDSNGSSSNERKEKYAEEDVKVTALTLAEELVKQRLKAPASADFENVNDQVNKMEVSNGDYTINSFVDAQNSFGAKLRMSYTVKLHFDGGDRDDNKNWHLLSINLEDQ